MGVRIPREIAGRVGLTEKASLEIEAKNDKIVLSPSRPRYRLENLLTGMTPRAMRAAYDWGPDKGREAVDEWATGRKPATSSGRMSIPASGGNKVAGVQHWSCHRQRSGTPAVF